MTISSHIHELANPSFFTPCIIVNDQGDLDTTNLIKWCYEKICGAFGYKNMCDEKLIGLVLIRDLYLLSEEQKLSEEKKITNENISDITKVASRAGLVETETLQEQKVSGAYLLFNFPEMLRKESQEENFPTKLKNILVQEYTKNTTILNCYPEKIKNIFSDLVRENSPPKYEEFSEDLTYTSSSSDGESVIFSEESSDEINK